MQFIAPNIPIKFLNIVLDFFASIRFISGDTNQIRYLCIESALEAEEGELVLQLLTSLMHKIHQLEKHSGVVKDLRNTHSKPTNPPKNVSLTSEKNLKGSVKSSKRITNGTFFSTIDLRNHKHPKISNQDDLKITYTIIS